MDLKRSLVIVFVFISVEVIPQINFIFDSRKADSLELL